MSSYVEMRGRQGRDQIRALYAHADMFVAPAQLESFGIAALEARCAGLPVVAMAASGIRDVIRSGQEGLLVDTDEQMAEAIVRLASSSRTRLRIARHNHLVAPPFDWPETLHRTEREYERAAAILARPLPAELDRSCNDQDHLHRRSASSA